MFNPQLGFVSVLLISFCISSVANADVLNLQSGRGIAGKIIQRTELSVTIDVAGVPQTYFLGEIASINGNKVDVHQTTVSTPKAPTAKASITVKKPPAVQRLHRHPPRTPPVPPQVVSTSDGSIVIVSNDKIIKYDKDLNLVKVVDIKSDLPVTSK